MLAEKDTGLLLDRFKTRWQAKPHVEALAVNRLDFP
jgi:hypothetical protein